jgi:hypothetical protein
MSQSINAQVKLSTGKQEGICPGCGNKIYIRVSGEKKNLQKGPYREYHAVCHHCKVTYTGTKHKNQW